MNKELTPLKALEIIYNSQDIMGGHDKFWEAYRIIEKALKEYTGFQIVFKLSNRNEGKKIHDELLALEIIKEKRVDVNDLMSFVKLKAYNNYVCACDDNDKRKLTQEEYELLKEVLKND